MSSSVEWPHGSPDPQSPAAKSPKTNEDKRGSHVIDFGLFKETSVTTSISVDDRPGSPRVPAGRISVQMEQSQLVEKVKIDETQPFGGLARTLSEPRRFQPTTTSLSQRSLTRTDYSVGEPSRPLSVVVPVTERKPVLEERDPLKELDDNQKIDAMV